MRTSVSATLKCTFSNEILKNSSLLQYKFGNKLRLMPNGFDEELLQSLNIVERNVKHKENLIITVGRLGTYQKNTEMFLRALAQVDLKDWKVCLIGPIEKKFQSIIDNFFKQYPEKIDAKIAPTNMTNERITPLLNPITVKIANIAKTHISSVSEFIGLPPKTQSHSKNIP